MCFHYDYYYQCGCFWMTRTDQCVENHAGRNCASVHQYKKFKFICVDHLAGLTDPPRGDLGLWMGPATPRSDRSSVPREDRGSRNPR
ncbi:hypothetical protein FQN54_006077 [Arachnomyces sp. PD_36]|nr:hypothetical protein FQN54_006077 [Arachnomyces sp. PD_36]